MKRTQLTMMALATMLAAGVMTTASAADFSSWQRKMQITFTGYNPPGGATTLTNFPALVALSTNLAGFSYGDFQSLTNQDLRFADANGNELNYEIESWNTNGSSYVWFQVTNLVNASTYVQAYWGKIGVTAPAYTTNGATWDASFAAVWHMNQTGSRDSTTNANLGTAHVNTNATGLIDGAQGLNGAAGTYVSVPNNATLNFTNAALTLSAWAFLNVAGASERAFVRKESQWALELSPTANKLRSLVTTTNGTTGWTANNDVAFTTPLAQWCYFGFTYNGAALKYYANGAQIGTNMIVSGAIATNANALAIGSATGGATLNVNGVMDEVRVESVARSSNWVWACYLNMASNGVFNGYGAVTGGGWPQISDGVSQNLSNTSVDVVGTLITSGTSATTVYLFCATNDCTTNATNWVASGTVTTNGPFTSGAVLTNTLSVLAPNTVYCWNLMASNSLGIAWGATLVSPSFKTMGPPGINNGAGATGITEFSATLNGRLTNGVSAHVYLLLGLQDGVWSVTNNVGTPAEGAFSFPVSGLTLATTYYYTSYATNAYGTAQATPSTNFTTWAGQTYVFTNNNQNWTVPGNWTGGSFAPPHNGDIGYITNKIALANGNLYNVGVDTPPAQIWVQTTNASLQITNGVTLAEHNIVLDGGTLAESTSAGTATNNGSIRINSNSSLGLSNIASSLTLNGPIQDNGANTGTLATKDNNSAYTFTGYILATNNTWTGGLKVGGLSAVYAGAPGCLGTGPILVTNGLLVTAWQRPTNTANINVVAVTNVFGCGTVTVCGASATISRYNNGELEMLGDSPNATYILNSGGIFAMHTNLVGGTLILNGGMIGVTDYQSGVFSGSYGDGWYVGPTFYGPIRVRGNSYLGSLSGGTLGNNDKFTLSGQIQDDGANTGTLITQPPITYQANIYLYNTNSTWTGGLLVQGQLVYAAASNCLGCGAIAVNNVSTRPGGGANREVFQLSVPYAGMSVASFTVGANGYLIVGDSNVVGSVPIVLNPGATMLYYSPDSTPRGFSGNTIVSGNGTVYAKTYRATLTTMDTFLVNTSVTFNAFYGSSYYGTILTLNGYIGDGTTTGQVIKGVNNDSSSSVGNDWIKLGCATNHYSGGTDVQRGPMEVLAAGALSTGNVAIDSGGRLKTSAANSLGSVTGAGHTISVNANGALELNSAETAPYTLQTGGALKMDVAGSLFTYGSGGNIQLAQGAILDSSITALPSHAVVASQLLPGDGRFGLYEGHNGAVGNYTTTRVFGDDNNTNIWRGLALLNCGSTMICANTMTTNVGTAYLDFYAQRDATLTFSNASLQANTVLLNGQGTFVFQNGSGASTYNNIYYDGGSLGVGGLKIVSNGDVRAGATVSVSNGWFAVSYTDSLANLTINLNGGAVFNITTNLTSGTINVNPGSATYVNNGLRMTNGANWIVYAGSQIGVGVGSRGGNAPIYDLPANGLADFVGWNDYYQPYSLFLNKGLVLGNNTRFTSGPYNDGYYIVTKLTVQDSDGGGDAFRLAAGSTQCRLCSPSGTVNTITLPVNLNAGAGKLIVGDTNLFNALIVGGTSGFLPITQNGTVYLNNPTNQIGDVEIQAGTLEVNSLAALGGTSAAAGGSRTIAISNAATMWFNYANPALSNTTLRGSGTLVMSTPTDTLTLTNAAGANSAIQPGIAGPLSVQGNLTLAASATPTPFTVNIGKTAGVATNALLAVTGNVTGLTNASLSVTFDPKMNASDVAGKVFTILTCANDLSATHFNSVTWAAPAKGGTVVYANGAVQLTTVSIPASGTTIFIR